MTGPEFTARRLKLGLTQEQVADRLGCSRVAVSLWENDRRRIPSSAADMLRRIRRPRTTTTNKAAGKEPQS